LKHTKDLNAFTTFVILEYGNNKLINDYFWGIKKVNSAEIVALEADLPRFLNETFLSSGSEDAYDKGFLHADCFGENHIIPIPISPVNLQQFQSMFAGRDIHRVKEQKVFSALVESPQSSRGKQFVFGFLHQREPFTPAELENWI